MRLQLQNLVWTTAGASPVKYVQLRTTPARCRKALFTYICLQRHCCFCVPAMAGLSQVLTQHCRHYLFTNDACLDCSCPYHISSGPKEYDITACDNLRGILVASHVLNHTELLGTRFCGVLVFLISLVYDSCWEGASRPNGM